MKERVLQFAHAAYDWENATPVGCGSLGAMLYGRVDEERLVLNEEHIWNGDRIEIQADNFREHLDQARAMFLRGENEQADRWMASAFDGNFSTVKSYEYAGELRIALHPTDACQNYQRSLDLKNGIAAVKYTQYNRHYERQLFASYPRKLLVYRFDANDIFSVSYHREFIRSLTVTGCNLTALCSTADAGHHFCVNLRVESDGLIEGLADCIRVTGATWGIIYISIVTAYETADYVSETQRRLKCCADGWNAIFSEHVADFSKIMNRSDIDLGGDPELSILPIETRLTRLRLDDNARDPELLSLYYQFGRYLLVSSSRPGSLPANLQGLWVAGLNAPWNSDYHTNINLQMNYWPAETTNLPECALPLFDFMNQVLLPSGQETARKLYHMRGTVLHHVSDLYGYTGPADGIWGMWPLGGAWLCFHLWEHYLFAPDESFLRNTAYDYIHESVLFFLDNLFLDNQGRLLSGPSASPENAYYVNGEGSYRADMSLSPTMDVEIIGGLLRIYIEVEKRLNLDCETAQKAKRSLEKIPPLQIGRHGQLMEWLNDYEEPEPGHRHISHGFALYPDCAITRQTPELMEAMRITMERRLSHGGGHTGWSRAWLILMFARLKDQRRTDENLMALLRCSTLDNLFDNHPPFQIDGNLGGAAGIAEMLLQSHEGFICLLPALAESYASGHFQGLRARGGYEVNAVWTKNQLQQFDIFTSHSEQIKVELPASQTNGCFIDAYGNEYMSTARMLTLKLNSGWNQFSLVPQPAV